jgi:holo-[acyl-carrier protein] synthase
MILGIGIDICKISRIADLIKKYPNFHEKLNAEIDSSAHVLAKKWSAIEALAKASKLGLAELAFSEVKIKHDISGAPYFELTENTTKKIHDQFNSSFKTHLSISDDGDYAIAYVIIENHI